MRISASIDDAVTHEQEDAYGFEWVETALKLVSGESTRGSRPPWSMLAAANGRRVFRPSDPQRTLTDQSSRMGSVDLCGQPLRLTRKFPPQYPLNCLSKLLPRQRRL
jgi:hypothetical protein